MSNWLSGVDLADVARLRDVVVLAVERDRALRCGERDGLRLRRGVHLVDVERAGRLDEGLVQVQRDVGGLHRVGGDAAAVGVGLPALDELRVGVGLERLEVVPGRVVAGDLVAHGRRLLLGDRHRDDRRRRRREAGVVVGLDEADVRRAVDGVEDEVGLGRHDLRHLGGPVVLVEGHVLLADDLDAELGRVELDDRVRGAREDVVAAGEEQPLHPLGGEEVHRRDDLLVGGRTGVVDVRRRLEALVLHRVEEQAVVLLDDRLDGLAGGRGPAAEDRADAVLGEQLLGLLREGGPVGGAVFLDVLDLLSEDAAAGVDLVGGHVQHVGDGLLGDRHAAGEGVEEAELDGVAGGVDAAGLRPTRRRPCRRRRGRHSRRARGRRSSRWRPWPQACAAACWWWTYVGTPFLVKEA